MSTDNTMSRLSNQLVRNLKSVGEPSLSPDASRLAYTLSWIDQDQLQTKSQIIVRGLPDGTEHKFTRGPNDINAKFSPSGNYLAFLRPTQISHIQQTRQ
ncbi:MAG: hypothetical protein CM1200mP3_18500 [Chloroflexota bacterium]|nr:MAG: hypothetical protein CM1200mP3_18500 [Chloroflexota bacterium]